MMIVDDEKIIRETISSIIDWSHYDIEITGLCRNGIEAYDMILDESPNLVLTDIRMPGMDGIELIKKVSQTDLNTMFILLSGYGEFEYAKTAMKYGVKNYLLKPFNELQIIEAVEPVSYTHLYVRHLSCQNILHMVGSHVSNADNSKSHLSVHVLSPFIFKNPYSTPSSRKC